MQRAIVFALIVAGLGGCSGGCDLNTFQPPNASTPVHEPDKGEVPKPMDPGDVEAQLQVNARVCDQSLADNVEVNALTDKVREVTAMITVNVSPPYPNEFWLGYELTNKSFVSECPLVFRIRVFREVDDGPKTEIGVFPTSKPSGRLDLEHYEELDALAGLEGPPETILVSSQIDVLLLTEGQSVESIDPATIAVPVEDAGAVLGPPVRINFGGNEDAL